MSNYQVGLDLKTINANLCGNGALPPLQHRILPLIISVLRIHYIH